jgi:hypothetical protein
MMGIESALKANSSIPDSASTNAFQPVIPFVKYAN